MVLLILSSLKKPVKHELLSKVPGCKMGLRVGIDDLAESIVSRTEVLREVKLFRSTSYGWCFLFGELFGDVTLLFLIKGACNPSKLLRALCRIPQVLHS